MSCNLWKLSRSFSKRLKKSVRQSTPHIHTRCLNHLIKVFISRIQFQFLCFINVFRRYVPPITSTSPIPETPDEINAELKKQDSLLNQIHAEMNAGFVTKKREEQLWEVQRIITQLKVGVSDVGDVSCYGFFLIDTLILSINSIIR